MLIYRCPQKTISFQWYTMMLLMMTWVNLWMLTSSTSSEPSLLLCPRTALACPVTPRHFLSSHDFCANIWNIYQKYIWSIFEMYLIYLNTPRHILPRTFSDDKCANTTWMSKIKYFRCKWIAETWAQINFLYRELLWTGMMVTLRAHGTSPVRAHQVSTTYNNCFIPVPFSSITIKIKDNLIRR